MTTQEYLEKLPTVVINEEKRKAIQDKYNLIIGDEVARIISFSDDSLFLREELRAMAYSEILKASETYGVDFANLKIIPLFDCFDNDFIVYHADSSIWSKFNVSDGVSFKERENLSLLLQ